jgi:hypothetical protein
VQLRYLAPTFQIIEGRLHSIGTTRSRIYLNFGPDRRRDFNVSISRREAARLGLDGSDAAAARGRMVRVRGWIGSGSAPHVDAISADQVEWIESLTIAAPRRPWRRQ